MDTSVAISNFSALYPNSYNSGMNHDVYTQHMPYMIAIQVTQTIIVQYIPIGIPAYNVKLSLVSILGMTKLLDFSQ